MTLKPFKRLAAFLVITLICQGPTSAKAQEAIYRLDAGDRVRVTVFGHEDLSGNFEVDGAGRLSLPLIQHVRAAGSTLAELEEAITNKLKPDFLKNPRVSVQPAPRGSLSTDQRDIFGTEDEMPALMAEDRNVSGAETEAIEWPNVGVDRVVPPQPRADVQSNKPPSQQASDKGLAVRSLTVRETPEDTVTGSPPLPAADNRGVRSLGPIEPDNSGGVGPSIGLPAPTVADDLRPEDTTRARLAELAKLPGDSQEVDTAVETLSPRPL